MHRMIEITVPPDVALQMREPLLNNPQVISFSWQKGISQKPAGKDVLQIQVLNRGADDVLALVQQYAANSGYSVVTSEVTSIIEPGSQKLIDNDVDEAIWEEVETGLRHNGRITPNFMMLMALGGVITAIGFVGDVQLQVIAFIAASIIAPGLEPIAKFSLGLALRKREVWWEGLKSTVVGYLLLMAAAALTFAILLLTHSAHPYQFLQDDFTIGLQDVTLKDFISSMAAAAASIIMYLSYRRNVIAGPLIVLVTIPAACGAAMSMVLGQWQFAGLMLYRFGADLLLIVIISATFILVKQRFVHRRRPLV